MRDLFALICRLPEFQEGFGYWISFSTGNKRAAEQ
ncbi:hypothetical protein CYPRO_1947 [Cyclonatronum proteinivorum]|uniref:Uncharacterized protein n=1 Tax=Cyclonatronum proteinivorum TaxID=1457365 RepID=A0A345UL45_9BACT|nr:hypothetical protein CYPRO_1947 [Cyclonatronum proteinivorum]